MDNFTFYSPTLFAFGEGEETKTGALVRQFGGTKVLLVYGGGSIKGNGAYDAVTASLTAAGIPWLELSGIQANPRSDKVYAGIELARREGCDFLLAVGGGSVIDTAKAIAFGVPYDGDFWDVFEGKHVVQECLPIGAVLTIAAAGSEGSPNCVITQERGNQKWGCPLNDLLRPKFAVMNPRFTCSLPRYQVACGAADMMAHILERYFSHTPDVALTDRLCEALLKTVLDAAPLAVADDTHYTAHADLMWAGMLAHNNLCGTGRVQDWASHQMGHELSARYNCAHGASLAIMMPAWMEYVYQQDVARFARFAVNVMGCEMDFADPQRTAKAGIARFRAFLASLGLPTSLKEVGGSAEDIPAIVDHRRPKPNAFPFGNFMKIGPEEMTAIYHLADR